MGQKLTSSPEHSRLKLCGVSEPNQRLTKFTRNRPQSPEHSSLSGRKETDRRRVIAPISSDTTGFETESSRCATEWLLCYIDGFPARLSAS
jgi:hypothetical protein